MSDYIPPPYKSLEECAEQTQQDLWNRKEDQYIGQHRYSYPQLNFEGRHSGLQSSALLRHPLCLDEQNLGGNPFFFIGRLEHFNQDFTALLSVLGLPYRSIGKSNVAKERTVQGQKKTL